MNLVFRLVAVGDIDSTNEELKRRAQAGEAEGLVLSAVQQSAGRGRRGRQWQSLPGNLYTSLLLRPSQVISAAANLGFLAAIALCDQLRGCLDSSGAPGRVTLKWPNDVLVDGCKIAGFLLEASSRADGRLDWLVLGLGLNLIYHPADTPYPAIDLAAAGGPALTPEAALAAFLDRFGPLYAEWSKKGFAPIRQAWLDRAEGLGGSMTIRLDGGSLDGIFRDLDADGALILETADGKTRRIAAGDIFFPTR